MYTVKVLEANFFRKKRKYALNGIKETFDDIFERYDPLIVFEKSFDTYVEYYLYSLETGNLIIKSINLPIRLNIGLENFFYIKKENKEKEKEFYLFELNLEVERKIKLESMIIVDKYTDIEKLDKYAILNFKFKCNKYFGGERGYNNYGIFFKKPNEIIYLENKKDIQSFKFSFKNNNVDDRYEVDVYYSEFSGRCVVVRLEEKLVKGDEDCSFKYYLNLYDFEAKKFVFNTFINSWIKTYKEYENGKKYVITDTLNIVDENGEKIGFEPLAQDLKFHETLPYVYTERSDRWGLISLEAKKIVFKPIYIDIIVDEDSFFVLDSVGGVYKRVCRKDI